MKNLLLLSVFILQLNIYSQQKKDLVAALEFQSELNRQFAEKSTSPLTPEDLVTFNGLDFYPINEDYIVEARFVKLKNEKVFSMKTSTSRLPEYKRFGELHFLIGGKTYRLIVYQNLELIKKPGYENHLFLPFSDLTCGNDSYIGGRYIDLKIPNSDKVVIDFNRAYNPYCAYNHRFSCPIVPLENDLNVEIRAGVKKFHD